VRLGTRGSALALAQARLVADRLEAAGHEVEVVAIRTSGDRGRGGGRGSPAGGGDKARFVKEIEDALVEGELDLGVHSAKDVPSELPEGLAVVGVPERGDARDAVCGAGSLADVPRGAVVGTSSLRRRAQLLALRPDLEVRELRGNVDTRLRRLGEGAFDALLLAAAGLERLGRADEGVPIAPDEVTPAPGQGCLALEGRIDDELAAAAGAELTDRSALVRLTAERALVAALGATCRTPVGAHAVLSDDSLTLSAFVGLPDGSLWARDRLEGDPEEAAALGEEVAARLLAAGAGDMLEQAERAAV
jgi:hydroxymethylbilane synthase